jgi:hypothetical protein
MKKMSYKRPKNDLKNKNWPIPGSGCENATFGGWFDMESHHSITKCDNMRNSMKIFDRLLFRTIKILN